MEEENEGVIVRHSMCALALRYRHKVLTVPECAQISPTHMAVLLSRFALPVCPHMRLNDPRVVQTYGPNATPIKGPALLDEMHPQNRARCTFPGCKSEISWLVLPSPGKSQDDNDTSNSSETRSTRQKIIYLRTTRILGDLHRFANPSFLAQLIVPNTEKLMDHWRRCHEWKDSIAPLIERQYAQEALNANNTEFNTRSSPGTSWIQISRLLTPSPLAHEDPFTTSEQTEALFWSVYNPGESDSEWKFSETDVPSHLSRDRTSYEYILN